MCNDVRPLLDHLGNPASSSIIPPMLFGSFINVDVFFSWC